MNIRKVSFYKLECAAKLLLGKPVNRNSDWNLGFRKRTENNNNKLDFLVPKPELSSITMSTPRFGNKKSSLFLLFSDSHQIDSQIVKQLLGSR